MTSSILSPALSSCRLFGIVLNKLLLFGGKKLEQDLAALGSPSELVVEDCTNPFYSQLIQLCFNARDSLSAALVAAFVRSISLNSFTDTDGVQLTDKHGSKAEQKIRKEGELLNHNFLEAMTSLKTKTKSFLASLSPLLKENAPENLQRQAIAVLSTAELQVLSEAIPDLLLGIQRASEEAVSEEGVILETILRERDEWRSIEEGESAISRISTCKFASQLKPVLLEFTRDSQWQYRRLAARYLRNVQDRGDDTAEEMVSAFRRESNVIVQREYMLTIGELQLDNTGITSLLREEIGSQDQLIPVYAAIALSNLSTKHVTQETRASCSSLLCQRVDLLDNPEDRKMVAKALGSLKQRNAQQTLLKLLMDEDSEVKRAAGRALSNIPTE